MLCIFYHKNSFCAALVGLQKVNGITRMCWIDYLSSTPRSYLWESVLFAKYSFLVLSLTGSYWDDQKSDLQGVAQRCNKRLEFTDTFYVPSFMVFNNHGTTFI
jgi:hypothetical protein